MARNDLWGKSLKYLQLALLLSAAQGRMLRREDMGGNVHVAPHPPYVPSFEGFQPFLAIPQEDAPRSPGGKRNRDSGNSKSSSLLPFMLARSIFKRLD